MKQAAKYCAVYTRKSTDERLDMEFNSLDAQRESCLAYITSQKAEGWKSINKQYDDGGFSGGSMERPALNELLEDIKAGKVNIVVVYKIDRLTRSLMDFSKLVEVFDKYGVTFVSITQSFNTTTSMGRLTLNVLLSFAQFEREVAGERIRDKIAASKKKGMWMGGSLPLGYIVKDRQLIIDKESAEKVEHIYHKYLELGSILKLKEYLDNAGIKSAVRISEKGKKSGGVNFSRGALNAILSNPVNIGKVHHKGNIYEGQHEAILSRELFNNVQEKLKSQSMTERGHKKQLGGSLLKGKIFGSDGALYTPTYTSKSGKRYRYYISSNIKELRNQPQGVIARLPANEIEALVERTLRGKLADKEKSAELLGLDIVNDNFILNHLANSQGSIPLEKMFDALKKVVIDTAKIDFCIDRVVFRAMVSDVLNWVIDNSCSDATVEFSIPYREHRADKGAVIIKPKSDSSDDIFDLPPQELKKLVQGVVWRDEHFKGMSLKEIAVREGVSDSFVGKCIFRVFDIS